MFARFLCLVLYFLQLIIFNINLELIFLYKTTIIKD